MNSPQTRSVPKSALRASLCATAFLLATTAASAFQWSDTFIGYRWGTDYREPANPKKIAKNIVQFQHVNGYAYGSNYLNIDALFSNKDDPANKVADPSAASDRGAAEFYCVFRSTLSLGKISKASGKKIKWGAFRDIGLTGGFDLSTKNDAFASEVREFFIGPTFELDVPGFLNVSILLDKENNHNGIIGQNVYFDPTYCVSLSWGIPVGKRGSVFKGFANFIGSKGRDGFGNQTAPETLVEAALMFPFSRKEPLKSRLFAGIGYQYWNNKFGNDASLPANAGCRTSLPQLLAEFHF